MQISMYITSFLIHIGRDDTERVKSTEIFRISLFLNPLLCCLFSPNSSYNDTNMALNSPSHFFHKTKSNRVADSKKKKKELIK